MKPLITTMSFTPDSSVIITLPEGAKPVTANDGDKSIDVFNIGWSTPGRFGIPKISDDIDQIMVEAHEQKLLYKEPVKGKDFDIYKINVFDIDRKAYVSVPLSYFTAVKIVGLKLTEFEKILASCHTRKELLFALQDSVFRTDDDFHGVGKNRFFRLHH